MTPSNPLKNSTTVLFIADIPELIILIFGTIVIITITALCYVNTLSTIFAFPFVRATICVAANKIHQKVSTGGVAEKVLQTKNAQNY